MIEPMLLKTCTSTDLSVYEGEWVAQVKFDGTRIIAIKENDTVIFQTRSGKSDLAGEYPELVELLRNKKAGQFIIDGELTFRNRDGKEVFLTGKAKESREGLTAHLSLFDILELDGRNYRTMPLTERLKHLDVFVKGETSCTLGVVVSHESKFNELYDFIIKSGGEGIVLKKKDSIYEDGKRSKYWLKVKRVETHDCFVIGLMKGEGKFADLFGSVVLGQYEGDKIKVVGACSGFDDATRNQIYDVIIAQPSYESFPVTARRMHHYVKRVAPILPMEIECMERHANGMMRHPRFLRFRDDKKESDCVWMMKRN